jgi:K+-transporting ATPase ATPase C chain
VPYNARTSGGSNLGPSNPALVKAVRERVRALREADPGNKAPIPVDLVTASGSGLDPHLSPAAAAYQVPRVARLRGLIEGEVRRLVAQFTEPRVLGLLGEPRVNVLELNLALDQLQAGRAGRGQIGPGATDSV